MYANQNTEQKIIKSEDQNIEKASTVIGMGAAVGIAIPTLDIFGAMVGNHFENQKSEEIAYFSEQKSILGDDAIVEKGLTVNFGDKTIIEIGENVTAAQKLESVKKEPYAKNHLMEAYLATGASMSGTFAIATIAGYACYKGAKDIGNKIIGKDKPKLG